MNRKQMQGQFLCSFCIRVFVTWRPLRYRYSFGERSRGRLEILLTQLCCMPIGAVRQRAFVVTSTAFEKRTDEMSGNDDCKAYFLELYVRPFKQNVLSLRVDQKATQEQFCCSLWIPTGVLNDHLTLIKNLLQHCSSPMYWALLKPVCVGRKRVLIDKICKLKIEQNVDLRTVLCGVLHPAILGVRKIAGPSPSFHIRMHRVTRRVSERQYRTPWNRAWTPFLPFRTPTWSAGRPFCLQANNLCSKIDQRANCSAGLGPHLGVLLNNVLMVGFGLCLKLPRQDSLEHCLARVGPFLAKLIYIFLKGKSWHTTLQD
jgi:hypothetical protein